MQAKTKNKTRRIYLLTILFIAIIATIGWMRFQQALRHWYYLISINLWPHPFYLAITGGLIGIGYSLALIFHFTQKPFTGLYLQLLGSSLIIWLWIDRIFIGMRESFPLLLAGTILITIMLILLDILIFKKNAYLKKKGTNGSEN